MAGRRRRVHDGGGGLVDVGAVLECVTEAAAVLDYGRRRRRAFLAPGAARNGQERPGAWSAAQSLTIDV